MASTSSPTDFANVGALPPPPGVTPHFNDFGSQQAGATTLDIVAIAVITPLVWIRLWTKGRISKDLGWDDYTCFMAWLGLLVYSTLDLVSMKYGTGIHQWDVTLEQYSQWLYIVSLTTIFYGVVIALTRVSILLQYLRIFVPLGTPRRLFYLVQVLIWFNVLFYAANTFLVIFQCTPREKFWKPWIPGHCLNNNSTLIRTAVVNVISDFFILVLPLKSTWELQMPRKRKIAISAVFGTGLLACVSAVVRLVQGIIYRNTQDYTYRLSKEAYWIGAEIFLGIICGCLPILPRFFIHYASKLAPNLFPNVSTRGRRASATISGSGYNSRSRGPSFIETLNAPVPHGNHIELGELTQHPRATGSTVIIEGGRHRSRSDERNPTTDSSVDSEIGTVPDSRILRTVRVETSFEE